MPVIVIEFRLQHFKFACTFEKSVNQFEKIEFEYDDEHEHEHEKSNALNLETL